MKSIFSLLVGIFLLCAAAMAQKPPIKFGDIPMEDMKMVVYPLDSGAEAVVLADYGESIIEYSDKEGFQINLERIQRIKILKKEGLQYAEFKIPLWNDASSGREERISNVKVVTYNLENGKIVETRVKNDNFFKQKYDKNLSYMKGVWTNVKEGSVIELTYRVKSDFLFNFQDWDFQSTIPVRWSEYRARIPEYYNYQKYMQGYVGLSINEEKMATKSFTYNYINNPGGGLLIPGETLREKESHVIEYSEQNFRWAAKDVPAFRMEPYMTTHQDYISRINFELAYTKFPGDGIKQIMGTWDDIGRAYWENVKSEINSNAGLKDDVEKLTASATSEEQKAIAIFSQVKQTVLWDETIRKYIDNSPRKTMDEKKGSSAEINILLACMLDKAGIAVSPVLLSTRDHGFISEQIPVSSQLNYVVCLAKIGEKSVLLDATDRMLPFGVLPERCLNGRGLVVSADKSTWVSLQPAVKSRTIYNADLKLNEAGEVNGTLKIDKVGYHSMRARRQYHSKGEGEYLKDYTKKTSWTVASSKFENTTDISLPFKESYELTVSEVGTAGNGTIYFNPFIISRKDENPFKAEQRNYPIDFVNQFEELYVLKITIPDGYVVDELPAAKLISLPENGGRYVYNFSQSGNTINLTSGLYINRSFFAQDVYPNLREFYSQLVAKQAEQIVLKKK